MPCTGEFGSLRPRRLCPTPEMVASRTFYGRLQLLGSMATVLTAPPVAVYSPELRQSVRSVRNKVSGVSRLLSPRAYETSTDGRFLRRHARRGCASCSVR